MLNINRIKRKKSAQERSNVCVASNLAKGLWQLMSVVVIVHLLGTLIISSIFIATNVQVDRLDPALEALTGSANQIYTLVITLATPVTVYSSAKAKLSKEK